MADTADKNENLEPAVSRRERWIDWITVVLLAAASVLAAWSGYQSAL